MCVGMIITKSIVTITSCGHVHTAGAHDRDLPCHVQSFSTSVRCCVRAQVGWACSTNEQVNDACEQFIFMMVAQS